MDTLISLAALLVFGYGLFSGRLSKTVISGPMLFVLAGVLAGPLGFDLFDPGLESEMVKVVAEVTLMVILFTDASTLKLGALKREYKVPLRLLAFGLPLTMMLGFALAVPMFPGVSLWLVAAMAFILSPTDAALGQAVVSSDQVPDEVRDTIEVESGLNDGIALPAVMACMAVIAAEADAEADVWQWVVFAAKQIGLGPVVGAAVGLVGGRLMDRAVQRDWMKPVFQRLASISLAVISYALAEEVGGNGFIAAFFGGLMLGTQTERVRERLQEFGEAEGQLLSLSVFLIFGMVLVPKLSDHWDMMALLYALLSLTVIRMLPVALCLMGTKMDRVTVAFIGWFGPRGIASVLYLLIFLTEVGGEGSERMLSVIVLTVLLSVLLHGVTAVPFSRWYGAYLEKKG
ncbi:cation:proton antiporter [Haloferula chungangensis]|uniref:Cation:proton antiporter n=1 Tax=Haloferula chungangensis TaxID=1048331 RepID=A0ABW2LE85_9BACT